MNWDDVAVPVSSELCVDGSINICHYLGPFCHSFPRIANVTEWSASGHWLHSPQPHRPACRFWWHWLLACLCYTGCQTPLFVYALMFPWQREIMAASASAALNWWLSPATRPLHHPEWAIRNDIRNETCWARRDKIWKIERRHPCSFR